MFDLSQSCSNHVRGNVDILVLLFGNVKGIVDSLVKLLHTRVPPGDILMFLTGMEEESMHGTSLVSLLMYIFQLPSKQLRVFRPLCQVFSQCKFYIKYSTDKDASHFLHHSWCGD